MYQGQFEANQSSNLSRLPTAGLDLLELRASWGERFLLKKRVMTIGSCPEADIRLEEPNGLAEHAKLVVRRGTLFVEDRGSGSVFVDGVPVHRTALNLGSVLRVGSSLFTLGRSSGAFSKSPAPPPLVGGAQMLRLQQKVVENADKDLNILIHGRAGGPQQLVARMIHQHSGRRGPFIVVDCSALPPAMLERELFGEPESDDGGMHGAIMVALGGTLYMEEITAMPRRIQERLVETLRKPSHMATCIVGTTTRDVDRAIVADQLCIDLHAHIAQAELELPALVDRREDIHVMILDQAWRQGSPDLEITPDALEALMLYDWPINEQELINMVSQGMRAESQTLGLDDLRPELSQLVSRRRAQAPRRRSRAQADGEPRQRVISALRKHHGNVRRASAEAGYSRSHFYRLLEQMSINPDSFRAPDPDAN